MSEQDERLKANLNRLIQGQKEMLVDLNLRIPELEEQIESVKESIKNTKKRIAEFEQQIAELP